MHDQRTVTRLGEGVSQTGRFSEGALERAKACLQQFAKDARSHAVDRIVAVATSAARDASNGKELFEVTKALGIELEIIEGVREAELTFLGAVSYGEAARDVTVIDIGGGSTEFVQQLANEIHGTSLDMGCVRFTEKHFTSLPPKDQELQQAIKNIVEHVKTLKIKKTKTLLAVAGTPTTLAQVDLGLAGFEPQRIEGHVLGLSFLNCQIERMQKMTSEEIKLIQGMDKKQAEIILMGTLLLAKSMEALGYDEVTVSTRGVRYGLALHQLGLRR